MNTNDAIYLLAVNTSKASRRAATYTECAKRSSTVAPLLPTQLRMKASLPPRKESSDLNVYRSPRQRN